jgi:hypothetical protein
MSELEADTGGEAETTVTSIAGLPASPRSGVIIAAGRLTIREICVLAAERSGASGISADGFRTSEEDRW